MLAAAAVPCEGQALALRGPGDAFFFGALRGTGPRTTGAGGAFFFGALRGTGPRTTGPGCVFFVVRGPVPRNRFLILAILQILAILLQTREILRSYRTFSPCCSCVL